MFTLEPPLDDALLISEVGDWSVEKHYFLQRYIDVFTTGMKARGWRSLHYIDLFSSAGIEKYRESRKLGWGSPLIAAQAPNQFTRLHLCELNREKCSALEQRLDRFPQPQHPQLICGDANVIVDQIVHELPSGSLSLAFLDPTGLHLHFETLRKLSQKRIDLIIFFPDHLDALRNWQAIYKDQPDSNLSKVLGTTAWQSRLEENSQSRWAEMLRLTYQEQIASLGYDHFDHERIARSDGRNLYILLFCSKHERGGEFWKKIASKKPDGQRMLDFG